MTRKPIPLESIREQWQRQIMAAPGRQPNHVVVAVAISWHLNRDTGDSWPGFATLAKETGLGHRTVKRAVKWLEANGHMHVAHSRGGNISNRYRPILSSGLGDTTAVVWVTESSGPSGTRTSKEPLTNLLMPVALAPGKQEEEFEIVNEGPKAKLFRVGKTLLVSLGISEKQSGSIIGRWLKQKNDPDGILAALQYAADHGVIEPIGYVTRLLATKDCRSEKLSLADQATELANRARELENNAGIGRPLAAL